MASVVGEREVDLTKLSLEQLSQLKTQLQEEVENFTKHYATLKDATSRLTSCRNTVVDLGPATSGTEILVPLTQSLYVPGKITDAERVLIDIGTGYYVEKTLPKAKEYLDRKISVVTKNAESIHTVVAQKEQSLRMVAAFMNRRIMMMSQQQQQNPAAAAAAAAQGKIGAK